jgi:hypothetical protein
MDLIEVKDKSKLNVARHPWELARLEVVKKLIAKHGNLSNGSIVLDVGCGDTFLVENVSSLFPQTDFIAVDTAFNDDLIELYQSHLKTTNVSLFSSLENASKKIYKEVSLVLLLDVIEHIENDVLFLQWLKKFSFIGENTIVLITVPAYQTLFCSHDIYLRHYRRYTNSRLKKNIRAAGFEPIKTGYFFFSLLLLRVLQVMKEKIQKPREMTTGLKEWDGGPFKTKFMKRVLLFDAGSSFFLKKTGINIPGLSNYIVCKKSV